MYSLARSVSRTSYCVVSRLNYNLGKALGFAADVALYSTHLALGTYRTLYQYHMIVLLKHEMTVACSYVL